MTETLDTGKTIRQITRLFAEIVELKQEVQSLRETVESLQLIVENSNDKDSGKATN